MEKQLAQLIIGSGDNVNATIPYAGEGSNFGFQSIGDIVSKSTQLIFVFAGFGLLLMLISGGYGYMTSMGNPKGMDAAKQRITNAIIGFILVFAAYWVAQLVGYILGFKGASILSTPAPRF